MRTLHMLHELEVAVGDRGSTVRKGFKWADLKRNERIELCVCTRDPETHDVQGEGAVTDMWVGLFREIPAYLLSFEHERRSREYWGLYDSMRKAYGDFSEADFVTVVLYDRVK